MGEDVRSEIEVIQKALSPLARKAGARPGCWVSGADIAERNYCSACARRVAKHLRRQGNRDAIMDGGWDPARTSDGSTYCAGCQSLLGYSLSEAGLEEEIDYWDGAPWVGPLKPCHAYEIEAVLDAACVFGDRDRLVVALAIGRRALSMMSHTPAEAPHG